METSVFRCVDELVLLTLFKSKSTGDRMNRKTNEFSPDLRTASTIRFVLDDTVRATLISATTLVMDDTVRSIIGTAVYFAGNAFVSAAINSAIRGANNA